ncbi:hypothetical protein [Streptomonospora salina]|uniref:Uncharacterized protein n=1 Tax=Streptomonospora salina TaxID=104205 RepID=A0A841E8G6_9ACTN|nr:hypothetical protein [Streptomonospora salina]MBB5998774.1 hypothetical protein [Streptomonospora salina]
MIVWTMDGPTVCVEAVITGSTSQGWTGRLFGVEPPEAFGNDVQAVRTALAAQVWAMVQDGVVSVPSATVDSVRIFATTVYEYSRTGEHSGAAVSVPCVADRFPKGWKAAAATPHEGLQLTAVGPTFGEARDALATQLLMALEVGVETVPSDWGGLSLMMRTRKTYQATAL